MIAVSDIHSLLPDTGVTGPLAFVCHQHLLPSVVPLLSMLFEWTGSRDLFWVMGKPYSTIQSTSSRLRDLGISVCEPTLPYPRAGYSTAMRDDLRALWRQVELAADRDGVSRIIAIDEGGYLADTVPSTLRPRVVAVEQTTYGTKALHCHVPTIHVALSQAKRTFETPAIAKAVLERLRQLIPGFDASRLGIIGMGPLGRELYKESISSGLPTLAFDIKNNLPSGVPAAAWTDHVKALVDASDVVVGCSGADCLPLQTLPANRSLYLASASSADIEFNSVLAASSKIDSSTLAPAELAMPGGARHLVLNGGFPINFDGMMEREPPQAMLLTRALMAAGVVQASRVPAGAKAGPQMLNPSWQREIVARWARRTGLVTMSDVPDDPMWWASTHEADHRK